MRVLLDSHALLWALRDDPLLPRSVAALMADPAVKRLVSAVSAYELCYKCARGRLPEAGDLCADFAREIGTVDCELLPLTVSHAQVAAKLDPAHRDPFDRLLIAQALVERVPIVSNEALFDRFGVERIW